MIQPHDDKKKLHEPFKLKSLMLDMDEYLRIFVVPQIPSEYKEYRGMIERAMESAWRAMFQAAVTVKRQRQRSLVQLKVELSILEVTIREIRDVCYRGKKKIDTSSLRRFEVLAKKQKDVMTFVWAWAKNEDKKLDSSKTEMTTGLIEREGI